MDEAIIRICRLHETILKLEDTEKALAHLTETTQQHPNFPGNDLIRKSLEKRQCALRKQLENPQ